MLKQIVHRFSSIIDRSVKTDFAAVKAQYLNSITGSSILELGPFYKPVCKGPNVKYFDILSQEGLQSRAAELTTVENARKVPFIHYVSPIGDLRIVDDKFAAVVSSHVIEHQLDLIRHLQHVSEILHDDGKYYLVIPDKRYCFDHFMNESGIAEVIDAHQSNRKRHQLKSVIEHRALTTHSDPRLHWHGQHGALENKATRISAAINEYNQGGYIDVHAWYFTPDSFYSIIKDLYDLDLIDLKVVELIPTRSESFDFFCTLERKPKDRFFSRSRHRSEDDN